MIRINPAWKRLVLGALLVAASTRSGLSEVSVRVVDGDCEGAMIMMSITEDPDPVGVAWKPHTHGPVNVIINPSGDPRGDLFPDLVFDPDDCVVQLVWPYNVGIGNYDIVYQKIAGGTPGPQELLSVGINKDLDPRIFVTDDGTVHATWWTDGYSVDEVSLKLREPGSSAWEPTVSVTDPGENGMRPSVAVFDDGKIRVAYEREATSPGIAGEIVIATLQELGSFTKQVVAETAYSGRCDPILHVAGDRIWLDWRHAEDSLAYSIYEGQGWSAPAIFPLADSTWVGIAGTRRAIQRTALGP